MPIDLQDLKAWIAKRGHPWLRYYGHPQLLPWIKRDGLLPRTVTKLRGTHSAPHLAGRPTHVYLGTREAAELAMSGVWICFVRVDLLDTSCIDMNEDEAGVHTSFSCVGELPRGGELRPRTLGETGGEWAERHKAIIDSPA
jgi:hypothetical protein